MTEEPLTPAEVLDRFKIKYDKNNPQKKICGLTRRRGNRPPMPSHRVGKELRFYWSEIRKRQMQTVCTVCAQSKMIDFVDTFVCVHKEESWTH